MLRTVSGPWCHDAPVKFWELWKCEFWKLCFHLCKYLSWKVRIMFPDYTGKLFLAGYEKCSGESCHLLLWSGVVQVISLCMSFESNSWLIEMQNMCLEETQCALVQLLKSNLGNSLRFIYPGIKMCSYGGEQWTGAVNSAKPTCPRLGCQWRNGVAWKGDDAGGKLENVYWIFACLDTFLVTLQ